MSRRGNYMDAVDATRAVNVRVDREGGPAAFAAKHGLSRQLVHHATEGSRPPSPTVLKACGIRRVVTTHYEIIEDAS